MELTPGLSSAGGTLTVDKDLTIDSIRGSITPATGYGDNTGTGDYAGGYNLGTFLTGGSRVATMDNATNATLINEKTINLVGPLVIGYEIQSDRVGSGRRTVRNTGTLTDEAETGTMLDYLMKD